MSDTTATGMQEYQRLVAGGFSQQEAESWKVEQTEKLLGGGFSNEEVDAYWGETKPDYSRLDNDVGAAVRGGGPKVAESATEALQAGWQSSVAGLVLRGQNPNVVPDEKAGWMADALTMGGQIAGDFVPGVVGAVVGAGAGASAGTAVTPGPGTVVGGLAGAGAGSMAVPTAMRETLMDYYTHRNGNYFKDFWTRLQDIAIKTSKSAIAGGIAGPVGGKLGGKILEKGGTQVAGRIGDYVANATTATALGGALDGHMPDKQDFTLGAGAALAMAVVTRGRAKPLSKAQEAAVQADIAQNLQDIYARTGFRPDEAVTRMKEDPAFAQEVYAPRAASGDPVTPVADAAMTPDPEPFEKPSRSPDLDGLQNAGFALHEEHATMIQRLQTEAMQRAGKKPDEAAPEITPEEMVKAAQDTHLDLIATLEGSANYAKAKGILEADVVSPAGAIGRYQIMPNTARQFGFDPARLTEPAYNEKVARAITQDLATRFPGDTVAQLIAYNAGPGRARSFIANGRNVRQLPLETQRYLERAQEMGAVKEDFIGENIDSQLAVQGDENWAPPPGNKTLHGEILPPERGGGGNGNEPPKPPIDGEIIQPERGPKKIADDTMHMTEDVLVEKINDIIAPADKEARFAWMQPRRIISQFQSELEPANAIDKKLGISGDKLGVEDMLRQTYASKERAGYFIRYGTLEPTPGEIKHTSDNSFIAAYKAVKEDGGDAAGFMAYRLAKRAIEKAGQGIDTGVDLAQAQRLVKLAGKKYDRAATIMRAAKDASIDYAVASGRFSKAGAAALKELNREHIVMRRVVDEGYRPVMGRFFKARNPLKKMTGSKKQVIDPVTTEIDNLHSIIAEADRNRARLTLVDAVKEHMQKHPDDTGLLKIEKVDFLDEDTGKAMTGDILDENGRVIPPLAKEGAKAFVAERILHSKLGPNDFVVYRDGLPEVWRSADEGLTELLRTPMPLKSNPVVALFQKFASLQRAGITAAVEFPVRVIIHSQIAHSAFADKSTVPFYDMMSGMMDVFKQSENYKAWVRNGGAGVALSDMDVNYLQKDIRAIWSETGTESAVLNAVKHPLEAMRMIQHMSDAAARIGYMKRMDKLGYTPLKGAALSRKAQLDFAERQTAAWVNTWAKMVPFMPSAIKDVEQVGTAFRDRPASTWAKAGLYFTLPTLVMYALNKQYDALLDENDPNRYSELPKWMRDMYWVTPPINGVRVKIQKPYVGSYPFSTLPERALDQFWMDDPHAMDKWGEALVAQMVPPYVPSLLAPVVEDKFNKSMFTGRPLVPASLEGASGYLQYNDNTSETAKKISQILGKPGYNVADVSPLVLQNYARQWAGTMPMTVLRQFEKPFRGPVKPQEMADNPFVGAFFVRHPDMGSQSVQNFFENSDEVLKAHRDFALAVEHQDFSEIDVASKEFTAYINVSNFKDAITNQMKVLKSINRSEDMTADEKRQYTDSIVSGAIAMAKAGSALVETVKQEQADGE